jgi:hypothetical protein
MAVVYLPDIALVTAKSKVVVNYATPLIARGINRPTSDRDSNPPSGYDNWCAVAGYFDGDGGLDVDVRRHTLHFVLNFVDNWPPQLWQIKLFLEREGVRVGAVRRAGVGGFKVEVAAIESLMRCAEAMLETRCLFKKRGELEMMLGYFKGTATGNQVIEFLNDEVRNGIRVGKLRAPPDLPYNYAEGLRISTRRDTRESALQPCKL